MPQPPLAERYEIIRTLGQGESATVSLAHDTWRANTPVVLKIQRADTGVSGRHLEREFGLLAGLRHPHLIEVHEVFEFTPPSEQNATRICLVQSLAPGVPMSTWALAATPSEIATVCAQVAAALSALHVHGIRHGDIKPENILVQANSLGLHATVIDFGLASQNENQQHAGGTPRFMAPEALEGKPTLAADIYSLAVTCAVCLGEPLPKALGQVVQSGRFSSELGAMSHSSAHKRPSAAEVFELFSTHASDTSLDDLEKLKDTGIRGKCVGQPLLMSNLEELLARGKKDGAVFCLEGTAGSGRTTFAKAAAARALMLGFQVPGGVREGSLGLLTPLEKFSKEPSHTGKLDDPAVLKWQRFAQTLESLAALAKHKPVAFIFDNVPPNSPLDEFAAYLSRTKMRAPGLLLIQTSSNTQNASHTTALPYLDREGVRAMIRARRPMRPGDEKAAEAVFGATGGHPSQVEWLLHSYSGPELLKASSRGKLHVDSAAYYEAPWQALGPEEQSLAIQLSLAPQPSFVHWWQYETNAAGKGFPERVNRLQQARMVDKESVNGKPAFTIPGESLRLFLRSQATHAHRSEVAHMLRAHLKTAPVHGSLGHLSLAIGNTEEAVSCFLEAAKHARDHLDLSQTANFLELALNNFSKSDKRHAQTRVALGKILAAQGQHEEAISHFESAPQLPEAQVELATTYLACGAYLKVPAVTQSLIDSEAPERDLAEVLTARAFLLGAKFEESHALIEQALARGAHSLTPRLLATRGLISYYRGEMDKARSDVELAYQQAHGMQDPDNLDLIRATLAMLLHKSNDATGAATLYQESLTAARTAHHLPRLVVRLTNFAVFKHEMGQFEQAVELYREAGDIAYRIDGEKERVRIGVTHGNLLYFLGDTEAAHTLVQNATEQAKLLGMQTEWAYLLVLGAEIEIAKGNTEPTHGMLALASQKFSEAGNHAGEIEAMGAQAQAWLVQNEFEQARAAAAQTMLDAMAIQRDRIAAQAAVWFALAHLPSDSPAAAGIERITEAIGWAKKLDEPDILWPLFLVASQLNARLGEETLAAKCFEQGCTVAARAFSRISGRYETSYAQVWHRRHLWRYLQGEMDFTPGHNTKTVDRILAINRALSRDHDPERLLERIIDAAITLSGAERGFIILQNPDDPDELIMRAARNMEQESPEGDESSFSRTIAVSVMQDGNIINTVNAQGDERFSEYRSVHHLNLKSVLCLPLQAPPHIIGALYLDHRHRVNAFSEVDGSMIGAFADQAAIALSNARLVSHLRSHSQELETTRAEVEELNLRLEEELKAQAAELAAVRKSRLKDDDEVLMQHGMIGTSSGMCKIYRVIDRVSDKDVPVTILGESGTGKELVARGVHAASPRKGQFVSVNCGAISQGLWESELFGHEKGSFTGAVRAKPGLFEIAHTGTLFLDEIGEMPVEVQVKLLRVLQQREFRRVGGTRTLHTDARVICATNRNLEEMVREGIFREDLWYRLNVVEIHLPPLRSRKDDVNLLLDHFLEKHGGRTPPQLTRRARASLLDYAWPGNIRELENEVQRACALAEGDIIPDDLSGKVSKGNSKPSAPVRLGGSLKDQVSQFESTLIVHSLQEFDGRVAAAADKLGLTRAGLYKKINKYKIDVNK